MRTPVRLLVALVVLVASSAECLCVGVAVWVGAGGGSAIGPGVAPPGGSGAGAAAVSWALAQVGTPYRWGGEGAGGFDCSGLVQAAFGAAGVALPRVAQAQYDAGPPLPAGATEQPGDLVFFGPSAARVDHVGIVVAPGQMVDAPHTGAVVRVEPIWSEAFVGATRPAP